MKISRLTTTPVVITTPHAGPPSHIKDPARLRKQKELEVEMARLVGDIRKIALQADQSASESTEFLENPIYILTMESQGSGSQNPASARQILTDCRLYVRKTHPAIQHLQDRKGKKRVRCEMEGFEKIAMAVISGTGQQKKNQERCYRRADERPTKRLNAFGGDGIASTSRILG
ncbi:hypothetical protein BDZ94DRAFT_1300420 [Collybia nuda]|uniref:Uncharacterized protein n=1 Tax=Collybia nuda TaxID=64659 RepID=A0A9P5XYV4_9AGAR|nr:hypothetical protein BDZ94DRAFT_1300420 [Collybia nuda]